MFGMGRAVPIQEELDEDQIKVSKKVLNHTLTNLLLGIRVRYMVDGFKVMGLLTHLGRLQLHVRLLFAMDAAYDIFSLL